MDSKQKITRRIILFSFLLFLIAMILPGFAGNNYNISNGVKPGMSVTQAEEILGKAEKVKDVERYFYDGWGQVVVKGEKIDDIRFSNGSGPASPLMYRNHSRDADDTNKLRYLRIGTAASTIEERAGVPNSKSLGQDRYYNDGETIIETHRDVVTAVNIGMHTGLDRLDWVKLNFSPMALLIMNITIAFIMFGVALGIKLENFTMIIKEPKSLILGIFSQFIALPALTFLLIYFIQPTPSVALGMILVAACPGGNVSNFMSSLAKGNVALSISLTAFATIVAVFMTPANFAFWGSLYSQTSNLIVPISIDFFEILRTVMLLLGLPVIAGVWFARKFPTLTQKIMKPVRQVSMVIFIIFIFMALLGNFEFFKSYIHLIIFIVLAHNALALITGFIIATVGRTPSTDRRSLTIETGIQNSGLGLVLIFNPRLFDGLGGMAFIAAWWGIWHIISGLILSTIWSRKPLPSEELETVEVNADRK
jgi:bile acid:Na+ symporter, BASS family